MWSETVVTVGVASYLASGLLPIRGIHDWLVPGTLFKVRPEALALSFDDGPDPERTPAVLDLLARRKATATFFLVGERAAGAPELVRRIAGEGHTIGNHSWSHRWLPRLSSRRMEADLSRCQELIAALTGQAPRLVRPPYGSRDFRFNRVARRLGLTPVLWSLDTRDWAGVGADRVYRRAHGARGGDIVMFHDGHPGARGTLPALARWLEAPPCEAPLEAIAPPAEV